MLGAAVIVFRETLEASLIIGIIAAVTRMLPTRNYSIAGGIMAGMLGALMVAALTAHIAEMAEGVGQELFSAAILGLATLMLAWHNIWMTRHGLQLSRAAKQLGQNVVAGKQAMSALCIVVALAILREGSETALFLYGLISAGAESLVTVASGGALGLVLGVAAGYGLYAGFVRIPVKYFFSATSVLILLLAAAMASQMARFLVQADLLPALIDPLWDTAWLLDNASLAGRVMHALAGYEARPSGMQAVFYLAVIVLIGTGMRMVRVHSLHSSAAHVSR